MIATLLLLFDDAGWLDVVAASAVGAKSGLVTVLRHAVRNGMNNSNRKTVHTLDSYEFHHQKRKLHNI